MRHQLEFFKSFLLKMKLVRIHQSNVKSWEAVGSAGSQLLKLKAGLSEKTCFFTVLEAIANLTLALCKRQKWKEQVKFS